jgi:hypothetical protein
VRSPPPQNEHVIETHRVDKGPYDGDYSNTRVYNNRIVSDGAFVKIGIGIGSRPWGDGTGVGAYGGLACDKYTSSAALRRRL